METAPNPTLVYITEALEAAQGLAARRRTQRVARDSFPTSAVPVQTPTQTAKKAPSRAGWGDDELENAALEWLISKESGGRTDAKNPTSSAFGLGQLIKSNRVAYAKRFGFDPDTTDYNQQLQMMKAYISDRYGSPRKAKEWWERKNWY